MTPVSPLTAKKPFDCEALKDLTEALGRGSRGSRVDEVIEHALAESEGAKLVTFEIEGAW